MIPSCSPTLTFGAGIGLAIAQYLISKSHNLVILARSIEPLEKLRTENPKQVKTLAGDLNDFAIAQTAVDSAIEAFGQLDGLVVNHGAMFGVDTVAECNIDEWRKMFDINYFSAVAFVRFQARRSGRALILLRPKQHYQLFEKPRVALSIPRREHRLAHIKPGARIRRAKQL